MKNAYSLFLCIPLFSFQTPEGPFLPPARAPSPLPLPNWTRGCWEPKEERMGRFRWSRMLPLLCSALHWHEHLFCLAQSQKASFTRGGILAGSRAPMGARKGPQAIGDSEGGWLS